MTVQPQFAAAAAAIDRGDTLVLAELLAQDAGLVHARGQTQETLLIHLIDWPGFRPRAAISAELLLKAGAVVDARRNATNGTPLAGAACTGEIEVIRVLLAHGADPNAACGWQSGTLLELIGEWSENLIWYGQSGNREIMALFSKVTGQLLPKRPMLGRSAPVLFVVEMKRALTFYLEILGYSSAFAMDETEDPNYALISRGGSELHLSLDDSDRAGRAACHIMVDPVEPLYQSYLAAGLQCTQELTSQPYGLMDFAFLDPDGNRLVMAGPARS